MALSTFGKHLDQSFAWWRSGTKWFGIITMKYHHLVVEFRGKNNQRIGVECKPVDAPRLTPSMHTAPQDLELSTLWVFYPGSKIYPLAENVFAIPLSKLSEDLSSEIFK